MDGNALRDLVSQGLAAMKAGARVAAAATEEISNDAKHPELREALEQANRGSEKWAQRIGQALEMAGGRGGEEQNPIVEAQTEVSRRIRRKAPDDTSRDLGIIADSQLALHYWIAAFGTVRSYAHQAGLNEVAEMMRTSLDEAKRADEHYTALARRILEA